MKILILLGAWASVPSWISTFRWKTAWNFNIDYFNINYIKKQNKKNKKELQKIIDYYKNIRKDFSNKKQNYYHDYIKKLQFQEDVFILSQNIDNLDYNIVNKENLIKLHWDLFKNRCLNNRKHNIWKNNDIWDKCQKCNSLIIPDILYYEETYPKEIVIKLNKLLKKEYDVFLLIWSSLEIWFINQIIGKIKAQFKININPELNLREFWFLQYSNFNDFIKKIWKTLITNDFE